MKRLTPAEIDYLVKNIHHYIYFIQLAAGETNINTFFSETSIFAYTIIKRVSRIYAKINNTNNTSFSQAFVNIFIPDETKSSIIAHKDLYSLNNLYPRLPPSTARPASARANAANARANVRANARANVRANARANAINARNIPNPSTKRTVTFRNNGYNANNRNNGNNRSRNNGNNANNRSRNNVNGYNANNENNTNNTVKRAKTVKRSKTANTRPAN